MSLRLPRSPLMNKGLDVHKILFRIVGVDQIERINGNLADAVAELLPDRLRDVGAAELAERLDVVEVREDPRLQPRRLDEGKVME